ncbi:MAG: recombination protein NinG [Spirochaetia bacterium]|nr:recombination protein NinG [Spirochaetia bacterium]
MRKYPKKITFAKARKDALTAKQKLRKVEEALLGSGICYCISCGKPNHWSAMDGGHFIPSTIRITELMDDDIYPQCKHCNGFLEGNSIAYEFNLRKKIGNDRVDRLIALRMASGGSDKHYALLSDEDKRLLVQKKTIPDYVQITKYCKARTKALIREKGIA